MRNGRIFPLWQRWQAFTQSLSDLSDSEDSLLAFFRSDKADTLMSDIQDTFASLMEKMGSGDTAGNIAPTRLNPQNLPGFLTQFMRFLMGYNADLQEDSPFIRFVSLSKFLGLWE